MFSPLLLSSILLRLALASDLSTTTTQYIRCHNDTGTVLQTVIVRSAIHCAALCSRNAHCQVINVCSRDDSPEQNVCSLLGNTSLQPMNLLENVTSQHCVPMMKVQLEPTNQVSETTETSAIVTTDPQECENNGTVENGQCKCPIEYGGAKCQRRIKDCAEAYENGHTLKYPGRPLFVQPVGSSAAFPIICIIWANVSVGYPLMRTNGASLNVNWTTAKTWIGDDLGKVSNYNSLDYFIGLDNLHNLLSQADYQANLNAYGSFSNGTSFEGWMYYSGFSVGPENSSYVLSYVSAWSSHGPRMDNGFNGSSPLVFSTNDRDPNHCHKGHPGWFGADCNGFSLFADVVQWPVQGSISTLNILNIGLVRTSGLTVN